MCVGVCPGVRLGVRVVVWRGAVQFICASQCARKLDFNFTALPAGASVEIR